jgi:hypothetical protein
MATLERIMQLKQQGQEEPQIIQILTQEGISPKEINEALSQSKIKTEINPQQQMQPAQGEQQMPGMQPTPGMQPQQYTQEAQMQQPQAAPQEQMQPSMMQQPMTQEIQAQPPAQAPVQQEYQQPAETGQIQPEYQDYTAEQPYQEYQAGADISTINEISEQIVEERTAEIKKQISSIKTFKQELEPEIQKIDQRLEKIENTLDQLQIAIIGKVGEFGKEIGNISKEMSASQNSFSKILNPLTDNIREMQKLTGKTPTRPSPKTKSKKQTSKFEDYLR